jgi:hypothetical protein
MDQATQTFAPPPGAPPPGPEVQPAQDVTPGRDFGKGPSPLAPQSPFAQSSTPQPYQDESAAYARKAEADKAAWQAREKSWQPIREKLQRELLAGTPPPPEQQRVPAPPSMDPQRYQENALAFVGVMAVLGALSGKFTRNSGNASLSAFAGAVKGWQTGNLEAYEQKSKEWEQTTKQMLMNNKMVLDKYRAVLENKSLNIEQQMLASKLIAAEYQDKIAFDALDAGNYTMFAQLHDKQTAAQDKAVDSFLKLSGDKFHETEQNQAKARQLETPEGQAWMQGLDPASRMKLEGFLKVYGSGAPPLASPGAPPAGGGATLDADAERYRQTGTLPANMGRGVQGAAQASAIRQRATELEVAAGGDPKDLPTKWQEFKAKGIGLNREQSSIGNRAGNVSLSVDEADRTVPIVRQLAEKSAGHGVAVWNTVENQWKVQTGDRAFAQYVTQMNSLINIYGRVLSGGTSGTVSDKEHARAMINPNMPLSAVEGALDAFQTEINIAQEAPERVRAAIQKKQKNQTGTQDSGATPPGGAAASDHSDLSDDELKAKLGIH